jgi:acyl-CoA synthetase (AMP-forming)/AMP-acid ligase II
MACVVNPMQGDHKIGSVGLALPDVEIVISSADDGKPMGPREVGEILIRAPQLMREYWGNPAETAIILRTRGEGEPWLHTGDLGYLDEDGYLFIVDRQKDLIKMSGFQVWPREVEEALATHFGPIAGRRWHPTRCRRISNSDTSCQRPWSAKYCGGSSRPKPMPRTPRPHDGSRTHVCVRPNREKPMYPRTSSLFPPSMTLIVQR